MAKITKEAALVVGFSYFVIFESIYDLTLFDDDYHPTTSIIEGRK